MSGKWLETLRRISPNVTQVAADEGKLKVLIDKILPLGEARRVHERIEERPGVGKVVLMP